MTGKDLAKRCAVLFGHFFGAIRRWRDYGGCSSRTEFWSFVGVAGALYVVLKLVTPEFDDIEGLLLPVIGLPFLALASRRFHDVGLSAWFVVLGFCTAQLSTLVIALVPSRDARKCWSEPDLSGAVEVSGSAALERHPGVTQHPRLSQRMRRAPIIQSLIWVFGILPPAFIALAFLWWALAKDCVATMGRPDVICSWFFEYVVFFLLCLLTPLCQWLVFFCFCRSEESVRAFRVVFALNFLPVAWLLLSQIKVLLLLK